MKQPRKRRAAAVAPGTLRAGRLRSPPSDAAQTVLASPTHSREDQDIDTATPIKHVIVLIGENRTFGHVFATYKLKHGQKGDRKPLRHVQFRRLARRDGQVARELTAAEND